MSLIMNTPLCSTSYANMGKDQCFLVPGMIKGAIAIPKTKYFTAADVADFKTVLQALTLEATVSERIFPLFRFEAIEDGSEDATIESLGYGGKAYVREGSYDFKFRYVDGGACLNKVLHGSELSQYKWLLVDSNNVIFGTINSDGYLAGLTTNFVQALPMKFNDGSASPMFRVQFNFSKPSELNKDMGYVQCDFDVEQEVKGLIDLEIREVASIEDSITVQVLTNCGKIDLYDTYADELADATMWTLTKAGVTVAISGVTKDTTNKGWTLAFTGSGDHVVGLTTPDLLAAADIGGYPGNGYEGIELTVDASGS